MPVQVGPGGGRVVLALLPIAAPGVIAPRLLLRPDDTDCPERPPA